MKKITSTIFLFFFVFCCTVTAFAADISLYINGNLIETEAPPKIIDGRTMVPIRDIFEGIGAEVEWDAERKMITANKDNSQVSMFLGSQFLMLNGNYIKMDVSPHVIDGRAYAPVKYAAEAFEYTATWDANTKTIYIEKNNNVKSTDDNVKINNLMGIDYGLYKSIKTTFENYITKISKCENYTEAENVANEFYNNGDFSLANYESDYENAQSDTERIFIQYVALATSYIAMAKDMDLYEPETTIIDNQTYEMSRFEKSASIVRFIFTAYDMDDVKNVIDELTDYMDETLEKFQSEN